MTDDFFPKEFAFNEPIEDDEFGSDDFDDGEEEVEEGFGGGIDEDEE